MSFKTRKSLIVFGFVCFVLLAFIQSQTTPNACEWTDPSSGTYYNFESLKKDPNNSWKVNDAADNGLFSMVYFFNFCTYHGKKCKNQQVAVSEVLEVLKKPTETCEILGKTDIRNVGLLEQGNPSKGIYVEYGGGDLCKNGDVPSENGKPRRTKFKLECASSQDENFVLDEPGGAQGTTKCVIEFKIKSPAGCPGGGSGRSYIKILFWFFIIMFVYAIAGVVYNMKTNNLSGKDAIPHIEFWREFPSLIQDGIIFTMKTLKNTANTIKGKLTGNTSGYNEV